MKQQIVKYTQNKLYSHTGINTTAHYAESGIPLKNNFLKIQRFYICSKFLILKRFKIQRF